MISNRLSLPPVQVLSLEGDGIVSLASRAVVELSSHGASEPDAKPTTLRTDDITLEERMVEFGSHNKALMVNSHPWVSRVQTVGPNFARERSVGSEGAQFSERRRSKRLDVRTMHELRARRVDFWQVKSKKATDGTLQVSEISRITDHMRIKRRRDNDGLGYIGFMWGS